MAYETQNSWFKFACTHSFSPRLFVDSFAIASFRATEGSRGISHCRAWRPFDSATLRSGGRTRFFIKHDRTAPMARGCNPLSHTIFSQERDLYLHLYLPQPISFRHPLAFEAQTCSMLCQSRGFGAQDGLRAIGSNM